MIEAAVEPVGTSAGIVEVPPLGRPNVREHVEPSLVERTRRDIDQLESEFLVYSAVYAFEPLRLVEADPANLRRNHKTQRAYDQNAGLEPTPDIEQFLMVDVVHRDRFDVGQGAQRPGAKWAATASC